MMQIFIPKPNCLITLQTDTSHMNDKRKSQNFLPLGEK